MDHSVQFSASALDNLYGINMDWLASLRVDLRKSRREATELFELDLPIINVFFIVGLCVGVLCAFMFVPHVCLVPLATLGLKLGWFWELSPDPMEE